MIIKNLTSVEVGTVSGGSCSDLTANIDPNELQACVTQLYNNVNHAKETSANVMDLYNDVKRAEEISANVAHLCSDTNMC
jgi:hypothetical protein